MGKRWSVFLAVGALTIGLCACGEKMVKPAERSSSPDLAQTPVPAAGTEKTTIEAYQEALWRLLEEHIDIDGSQISDDGWDFIQEVKFAVQDVDLDGNQELLVCYYRTTRVYEYDVENKELVEELWGTESCRFYDNGLVQIDSSHNQGKGGRFWPYNVSMYNVQTRKYDDVASLDAWDFELIPDPEHQKKVGAEGDEFIYYYTALEDPSDGEIREKRTMTQAEYDTWYSNTFGGAEEIEVDYRPLTWENIQNGCARAAYEKFLAEDISALPRSCEEDIYFYRVDREDVDQVKFERQLKCLVTDQLLEREAWRPVPAQQENGK